MKGIILSAAFLFIPFLSSAQVVTQDEAASWKSLTDVLEHQHIEKGVTDSIVSFEILIKFASNVSQLVSVYNQGNKFNEDVLKYLQKTESGTRIWFDNIKLIDPENKTSTLSISLKVE